MDTTQRTRSNLTLIAIAVHVGANAYESLKHRENMFKAMVTGRKRALHDEAAAPSDSLLDEWSDTLPSRSASLPRAHHP